MKSKPPQSIRGDERKYIEAQAEATAFVFRNVYIVSRAPCGSTVAVTSSQSFHSVHFHGMTPPSTFLSCSSHSSNPSLTLRVAAGLPLFLDDNHLDNLRLGLPLAVGVSTRSIRVGRGEALALVGESMIGMSAKLVRCRACFVRGDKASSHVPSVKSRSSSFKSSMVCLCALAKLWTSAAVVVTPVISTDLSCGKRRPGIAFGFALG